MDIILKTNNLTKKFGHNTAVNNVNMTISKGEIYGFIGKNGAGKTTFMKMVLSLTYPTSGSIELFNGEKSKDALKKVGSLIESPGLYKGATAYENMYRFSIIYGGGEKINELLELVGLSKVGKKKVKDFSLGMKQRLGIAISLLGDPEFLVLDEPINGLDPAGIKEIRDVILKINKKKGTTFLISSHLLDELSKVVTKYGIIDNGCLIEEVSKEELINRCQNKLVVTTKDSKKAKKVLSEIINPDNIIINGNDIEILSNIDKGEEINKLLCKNNIYASKICPTLDSLEDYFIRKIGDTIE